MCVSGVACEQARAFAQAKWEEGRPGWHPDALRITPAMRGLGSLEESESRNSENHFGDGPDDSASRLD